jgi:hypothetical protein
MKTIGKCFGPGLMHNEGLTAAERSKAREIIALAVNTCLAKLCKAPVIAGFLAAGFLAVSAHSAAAQATTTTVNLDGQVFVEPGDPVCPIGNFGTDTFFFTNGVYHQTLRPNGTESDTITGEGPFTMVPFDSSLPTCSGHFAFWQGDELNAYAGNFMPFTVDMETDCTDGSKVDVHWTGKVQYVDDQLHFMTNTFTCH